MVGSQWPAEPLAPHHAEADIVWQIDLAPKQDHRVIDIGQAKVGEVAAYLLRANRVRGVEKFETRTRRPRCTHASSALARAVRARATAVVRSEDIRDVKLGLRRRA